MNSFALYRLPRQQRCWLIEQEGPGEPVELLAPTALSGTQGFVIAPFAITPEQPILLIRPDRNISWQSADEIEAPELSACIPGDDVAFVPTSRAAYTADFHRFYEQLETGLFQKIVLARCATEPCDIAAGQPLRLFKKACALYPRLFVALVYTPKSGLWLTATPEILLQGRRHQWRTIALAGTMKLKSDELDGEGEHLSWKTKDIQEQRIVATYITDCLERFADTMTEEGPRSVRAANLVHLRSDFLFTLSQPSQVGALLGALHPTPAVCGLPKEEAQRFILNNEHTPRGYYSGFMGPLFMNEETHLFVSLRCMSISRDSCKLYAGGGLLRESTEEQEWQETEAKLETMRRCLADTAEETV